MQDYDPDESECELGVPIDDLVRTDIYNFDLDVDERVYRYGAPVFMK